MRALVILLILICAASRAACQEWDFGGHLKAQGSYSRLPDGVNSAISEDNPEVGEQLDLRGLAAYEQNGFGFVAHGEILAIEPELSPVGLIVPFTSLPDDRARLFDLTAELFEEDEGRGVARFDRLFLSSKTERFVFKAGREAVTWGNGQLFQSLDLFQPFTPTEIDRDYKLGSDLFFAQYLLPSGNDIQAVIVPRRDPDTHEVESNESTFGGKYYMHVENSTVDLEFVGAAHLGDPFLGTGIAFNWLDAVWRTDISVTDASGWTPQVVANVDRSFSACGLNWYGFMEYFHSEFGVSDSDYLPLPDELEKRLRRGELFTLAEDYLALGIRIETSPLTNLYTTHFSNLNDGSGILQLRYVIDWVTDWRITLGADFPYGGEGSEFGGLLLPGTDLSTQPPMDLYIRAAYFF